MSPSCPTPAPASLPLAGIYQVWAKDNREAAMRFTEASPSDPGTANVELKCFDSSANPYLVVGSPDASRLAMNQVAAWPRVADLRHPQGTSRARNARGLALV
jgi:hypothetical protein